ncbi:MAG: response regulator [Lachnospiraceae bacterium]|nr:response regulator [Lachnospiraceae bacterium]
MAKILIADDALFMRVTLGDILRGDGHEVCEAKNGSELLKVYEEEMPDLVMLDITMPEMDGLQALKALKQIHPKVKVVMCSAMGQKAMVMDAISHGAYDFIVKPFERSKVLESVRRVLAMNF